jgi:hypothetical protein
MLRYRIARDPKGRYFVLPALVGVVPLEETYSNREAARQTADWCNSVNRQERQRSAGRRAAAVDAACLILPTPSPLAR